MALTPKEVHPDKVAVYIRWSTDDQTQGTTLEVQREACEHYVRSQGWLVNENLVYVDDGYSGGNMDRPALARLRRAVRQGQVDCIVVYKLDRLSRSVIDTVKLALEEWDGRAYIKSAREPIDTGSPHGKMFFYLLASYAEWERNVIRERTHSGQLRRATEGKVAGFPAPYGYRNSGTPGTLEIIPHEREVVLRIFRSYLAGLGGKAIVTALNREGLPFRDGKPWNERTLLYLLSNPVYCGDLRYGRMTRNPRYGKEEGERFWVEGGAPIMVQDSAHVPAMISREDFQQAQAIKRRRADRAGKPSGRANASPYLLTGLARCRCGYSLYGRVNKSGGHEHLYYGCVGQKTRGRTHCDSRLVPQGALDEQVVGGLMERYGSQLGREEYRQRMHEAAGAELREVAGALAALEQAAEKLEGQLQKARRDYREGALSAAEYREVRREVEQELQGYRSRRQELALRREGAQVRLTQATAAMGWLDKVDRRAWDILSPQERKQVLRHFIGKLTVWAPADGDVEMEIEWH